MLDKFESFLRFIIWMILGVVLALVIIGSYDFARVGMTEGWHTAWGEYWH